MLRKVYRLKPVRLAFLPAGSTACGPVVGKNDSFLPIIQGKEPKPVGTVRGRFPLTSVKGSAMNSGVCRGLPCRNSTSTKPPANNTQVLEVLGVGPEGMKRQAEGKSRPVKWVSHQAAAPARKLRESSLDVTRDGEMERRRHSGWLPPVPPSSPVLQPTPPLTAMTPEQLASRLRVLRMNPCH